MQAYMFSCSLPHEKKIVCETHTAENSICIYAS